MGYEVPKPRVVQQTWGNGIAQAIQRERMMQHEKKLMDQELDYKKARDLVGDQKWNKEFDIREATAKTQQDIMKEQAVRMGKMNEQLQLENDRLITQSAQNEKIQDLKGWQAKDTMAKQDYQNQIDKLEIQASKWGGGSREASDKLASMRGEAGLGGAMEGGFFDWMGGTGDKENQGLATALQQSDPNYVSRQDFTRDIVNELGGLTSHSYEQIMNEPWGVANAASGMSDPNAINYVNQANQAPAPQIQQMYQNQQPVQIQQGIPPGPNPQRSRFSNALRASMPMGMGHFF